MCGNDGGSVKQLKKLTRTEKEAVSRARLNASDYGKVKDLSEQFIVIEHRENHTRKTIDLYKK